MLYAPRGSGKTFLGLGIGYAVASGGTVLRWKAAQPQRVLYVDGEMPLGVLQERLASIVAGAAEQPPGDFFQILAADAFDDGIPNLARSDGQTAIEPLLAGVSLLVIDNISTLASGGRDNDSDSWTPVQEWLLKLRRRGLSVLLIHHAGKGGQQRGTSRREDVLDTVIALRRPADYVPSEGARFEVHLEKARGISGSDAEPFEAKLEVFGSSATWSTKDLADANLSRVVEMTNDGLSIRDIAEETGIPKSTVARLKKKAEADGLIAKRASHEH